MSACSSAELEPGPLALLDESAAVIEPSPPVFAPLAKEFSDSLPGFYSAFDTASTVLAAESTLDIAGGIVEGLSAAPTHLESGVNQEALANLQVAEDGFRVARDKTAALQGGLPSDVQQPTFFTPLAFHVHDGAGAPIAGALITLDADFGNGATRVTDGGGNNGFGVATTGVVAWTVAHAGYATASGTAVLGHTPIVDVTLQAV